jgi:hypothetical protein
MSKPKLSEFKKYLDELDENGLREELLKLFKKLNQVQEFYAQELLSEEERAKILERYKKQIYNAFWTRTGTPKIQDNAFIKRVISEFEKTASFPYDVVDLLLYRVEITTEFANEYGGIPDNDYNASSTAFQKAMKLIKQHGLLEYFKKRCEDLFDYKKYNNLDSWYILDLKGIYKEHTSS